MELVIIDMEDLEIIFHQLIVTKNLKIGQSLVFYLLPMLPNKIPLKIFGYKLKIFYESIGIYVILLRLSNFCLTFSLRNINLISPKSISTSIHRKSFRIAIAERLGVHRITVHRWLTQYSVGGLTSLLKIGKLTGRPRVIPKAIIAGLSNKLSEESCEFKSYKEIGKWVEDKYPISAKYQTLHKQVHYRMKAKLKVPRTASIKKIMRQV